MPQPEFQIWLDNHFSSIVAKWLHDRFGWQVRSAWATHIHDLNDYALFELARQAAPMVILVTKDADFDPILDQKGAPPKIINCHLGNSGNREVFNFLAARLPEAVNILLNTDTPAADIY